MKDFDSKFLAFHEAQNCLCLTDVLSYRIALIVFVVLVLSHVTVYVIGHYKAKGCLATKAGTRDISASEEASIIDGHYFHTSEEAGTRDISASEEASIIEQGGQPQLEDPNVQELRAAMRRLALNVRLDVLKELRSESSEDSM